MKKFIKKAYIFLMMIFLYSPIAVLIVFSFNESKSRGKWGGFSLKWYVELLRDKDIKTALYYTLVIAVLSAVISTIIGTVSAIGIYNMNFLMKNVVLNINSLPILNPDIVTGVSLMLLFLFLNIKLGFITMLIAHTAFNIPYVILSVLPKLRQMDKNLPEAAMDLGATPYYTLKKIIIPEILPGILTGFILAFTLSLDDFVISFFTTGSGVSNLSIYVYSMARRGIKPVINALSTIMIVVVTALLVFINKRVSIEKIM